VAGVRAGYCFLVQDHTLKGVASTRVDAAAFRVWEGRVLPQSPGPDPAADVALQCQRRDITEDHVPGEEDLLLWQVDIGFLLG